MVSQMDYDDKTGDMSSNMLSVIGDGASFGVSIKRFIYPVQDSRHF